MKNFRLITGLALTMIAILGSLMIANARTLPTVSNVTSVGVTKTEKANKSNVSTKDSVNFQAEKINVNPATNFAGGCRAATINFNHLSDLQIKPSLTTHFSPPGLNRFDDHTKHPDKADLAEPKRKIPLKWLGFSSINLIKLE